MHRSAIWPRLRSLPYGNAPPTDPTLRRRRHRKDKSVQSGSDRQETLEAEKRNDLILVKTVVKEITLLPCHPPLTRRSAFNPPAETRARIPAAQWRLTLLARAPALGSPANGQFPPATIARSASGRGAVVAGRWRPRLACRPRSTAAGPVAPNHRLDDRRVAS